MPIDDDDRPRPKITHQLGQDLSLLSLDDLNERVGILEAEIDRLRREAKRVNQDLPTPRYTGVQRLIEVEGTPLLPPTDPGEPAAQPASTAPAVKPAAPRQDPDAVPAVPPPPALEPGPPFRPK